MQNIETRQKLVNLLLDIAESERQIEVLRQILCEIKDFEPYAAFQRIDRSRKNSLNVADILKFLSDNNMPHSEEYCSIFLKHYDIDCDNRLDYSEFLKVVLPADNPPLRALITQRETYKVSEDESLTYEVECALAKLIDKEISLSLRLDTQKLDLAKSEDYRDLDVFILVDVEGSGRINFLNLMQYFHKEEVYPADEEILALLRRIDREGNGLIPFEDFIQAIQPLESNPETLVNHLKTASLQQVSPTKSSRRSLSPSKKIPNQSSQSMNISNFGPKELERSAKIYASADMSERLMRSAKFDERSPERTSITRNKELSNKSPETVSPRKYRKEASPYRKIGAYSEIVKVKRDYDSATRSKRDMEDLKEYEYEKPRINNFEARLPYESRNVYKRETSPLTQSEKKFSRPRRDENVEEENCKAILEMFRHFIYLDREIEEVKKELAFQPDFNFFSLFKDFDVRERGKVEEFDIMKGMEKYGIYPDRDELFLFMRRFDQNNREALAFHEFIESFKPFQYVLSSIANTTINKKTLNESDSVQMFTEKIRSFIIRILRLHLENEKTAETLRKNLGKRNNFNLRRAFNLLDKNGDGFLTRETIKFCFEERGIYLSKQEYELLVYRLDHNRQGRISYLDFLKELNPRN